MPEQLTYEAFKKPSNTAARLAQIESATAEGKIVKCGWVSPDERTAETKREHELIVNAMPRFGIRGRFKAEQRRYALWQAGKTLLGKHLPYAWQQTGSCVGAGWYNMTITGMAVEIVIKQEWEQFLLPWWLYTYGRSRYYAGMRGRGEGSIGSAIAKASTQDGTFEIDPAGAPSDLPDYREDRGWVVQPARTELEWSDGGRIAETWLAIGRKHLWKTAAPARSADDVAEAIMNGYAVTQASSFGFRPMAPNPQGDPPVRLARWNGSWNHQTYFDEYWDHPTLGEIFRWGNNWGPDAHGSATGEEPAGGVYVTKATVNEIIRSSPGEIIVYSMLDGFPARDLVVEAFRKPSTRSLFLPN